MGNTISHLSAHLSRFTSIRVLHRSTPRESWMRSHLFWSHSRKLWICISQDGNNLFHFLYSKDTSMCRILWAENIYRMQTFVLQQLLSHEMVNSLRFQHHSHWSRFAKCSLQNIFWEMWLLRRLPRAHGCIMDPCCMNT